MTVNPDDPPACPIRRRLLSLLLVRPLSLAELVVLVAGAEATDAEVVLVVEALELLVRMGVLGVSNPEDLAVNEKPTVDERDLDRAEWLRPGEAAARIGVGVQTVLGLCEAGSLSHVRTSRAGLLVRRVDCDRHLESCEVERVA